MAGPAPSGRGRGFRDRLRVQHQDRRGRRALHRGHGVPRRPLHAGRPEVRPRGRLHRRKRGRRPVGVGQHRRPVAGGLPHLLRSGRPHRLAGDQQVLEGRPHLHLPHPLLDDRLRREPTTRAADALLRRTRRHRPAERADQAHRRRRLARRAPPVPGEPLQPGVLGRQHGRAWVRHATHHLQEHRGVAGLPRPGPAALRGREPPDHSVGAGL